MRPSPAAAGEHVVEDQTERIDVGAVIDVLAPRLLGRHVLDRADYGAASPSRPAPRRRDGNAAAAATSSAGPLIVVACWKRTRRPTGTIDARCRSP